MSTTPFHPQCTWRKLGYLAYTDSLAYREVLDQNPQWDVVTLPPLGAQISIDQTAQNSRGGLLQSAFVYGLPPATVTDAIYPFENSETYFDSLNRYTVAGVIDRARFNGFDQDDYEARTGIQG